MTNDVIEAKPAGAALSNLSTSDLRAELSRSLEITAKHLSYLAAVWRELESRGEDLSHLRSGLWAYMPLIASGRLRAEIVVQYAGHSMLLRRLADLPPEQQEQLLADNTVPLVEYTNGEFTERRIPINHLKASQINQVFSDHIRQPDEQRRSAISRSRGNSAREAKSRISGNPVLQLAQEIGRVEGDRVMLTVVLSESERAALDRHVEQAGVPLTKLLRALLIMNGLLK